MVLPYNLSTIPERDTLWIMKHIVVFDPVKESRAGGIVLAE